MVMHLRGEALSTGLPEEHDELEEPLRWGLYIRAVKPAIDRLAAVVLLLALLPVLLAVAVVVRAALGKGVLLRQERIGQHGRPFTLIKFRTMRPSRRITAGEREGEDRRRTHKTDADPRHTPVGRFLRKWSLDELPELINVASGDMSLVGPRPELPSIVAHYQPWQHARHHVKPGLTGLWQVSQRGDGLMHHFCHVDVDYARRVSARLDTRIFLATFPALLKRRGS